MVRPNPMSLVTNKDFSVVIFPRLKRISDPRTKNVPIINNNTPSLNNNLITSYKILKALRHLYKDEGP